MEDSPRHTIRIVTAAALFDGHDAAINIMRRILQSQGAEVIHLGHNRSAADIVAAAVEEDVQAVAITSYQGGHMEFFPYVRRLLDEQGCAHVRIFGGGGGTILPEEITALQASGITRIYSPDDGRRMGLRGMIEEVMRLADIPLPPPPPAEAGRLHPGDKRTLSALITLLENEGPGHRDWGEALQARGGPAVVVGVTGTGGAGKSTVTDELARRFLGQFPGRTMAIVSVDPSRKKSGGALLGDRIRMNTLPHPRAFMRSMATRDSGQVLSTHVRGALAACRAAGYDLIVLESPGIGQGDTAILEHSDVSLYVMTPEYGAASQLEKINMLDYADIVAMNKVDKAGAEDALHDVRKQYQRNHELWDLLPERMPVVGTTASRFNDEGMDALFALLLEKIAAKRSIRFGEAAPAARQSAAHPPLLPAGRERYLSEIAGTIRRHKRWIGEQADIASRLYRLEGAIAQLKESRQRRPDDHPLKPEDP